MCLPAETSSVVQVKYTNQVVIPHGIATMFFIFQTGPTDIGILGIR